jgi:hypothetical protein
MFIVNVKRVSITSAFKFYLLISFSLVNWICKHNLCAAASGPGLSVLFLWGALDYVSDWALACSICF